MPSGRELFPNAQPAFIEGFDAADADLAENPNLDPDWAEIGAAGESFYIGYYRRFHGTF
ncbi:hypothetical protein [Mycolicibacterium conceptionense]|uniref:hypothetical protein n=1 Tax=Mycolicibacterium conceptionense TaxID=451644 RepID=UPI000AAA0339|nr:hypothetical protein [Mycolicibacterium conceptionense]